MQSWPQLVLYALLILAWLPVDQADRTAARSDPDPKEELHAIVDHSDGKIEIVNRTIDEVDDKELKVKIREFKGLGDNLTKTLSHASDSGYDLTLLILDLAIADPGLSSFLQGVRIAANSSLRVELNGHSDRELTTPFPQLSPNITQLRIVGVTFEDSLPGNLHKHLSEDTRLEIKNCFFRGPLPPYFTSQDIMIDIEDTWFEWKLGPGGDNRGYRIDLYYSRGVKIHHFEKWEKVAAWLNGNPSITELQISPHKATGRDLSNFKFVRHISISGMAAVPMLDFPRLPQQKQNLTVALHDVWLATPAALKGILEAVNSLKGRLETNDVTWSVTPYQTANRAKVDMVRRDDPLACWTAITADDFPHSSFSDASFTTGINPIPELGCLEVRGAKLVRELPLEELTSVQALWIRGGKGDSDDVLELHLPPQLKSLRIVGTSGLHVMELPSTMVHIEISSNSKFRADLSTLPAMMRHAKIVGNSDLRGELMTLPATMEAIEIQDNPFFSNAVHPDWCYASNLHEIKVCGNQDTKQPTPLCIWDLPKGHKNVCSEKGKKPSEKELLTMCKAESSITYCGRDLNSGIMCRDRDSARILLAVWGPFVVCAVVLPTLPLLIEIANQEYGKNDGMKSDELLKKRQKIVRWIIKGFLPVVLYLWDIGSDVYLAAKLWGTIAGSIIVGIILFHCLVAVSLHIQVIWKISSKRRVDGATDTSLDRVFLDWAHKGGWWTKMVKISLLSIPGTLLFDLLALVAKFTGLRLKSVSKVIDLRAHFEGRAMTEALVEAPLQAIFLSVSYPYGTNKVLQLDVTRKIFLIAIIAALVSMLKGLAIVRVKAWKAKRSFWQTFYVIAIGEMIEEASDEAVDVGDFETGVQCVRLLLTTLT